MFDMQLNMSASISTVPPEVTARQMDEDLMFSVFCPSASKCNKSKIYPNQQIFSLKGEKKALLN